MSSIGEKERDCHGDACDMDCALEKTDMYCCVVSLSSSLILLKQMLLLFFPAHHGVVKVFYLLITMHFDFI